MSELTQVALTALISAAVLFVLTELMGQKQLSQLNMFDYVTGITIGSIAAEMATELEKNPLNGIAAMAVYALLGILFSYIGRKNLKLRRTLNGKIYLLMEDGKLNKKEFAKAHIDLSDFLMFARIQGYYDPSRISAALMEPNGALSFLPRESDRPATVEDLGLKREQSRMARNLIMDGKIMEESLRRSGISRRRLEEECRKNGYDRVEDVFLATVSNGVVTFY